MTAPFKSSADRRGGVYEITPSVTIEAPPAAVWARLVDVESWWVDSNPEHESLEVLTDPPVLAEGTRLRVHERIAGVPGVAEGAVTGFVPEERVTWEAPRARYRLFGLPVTVSEGVSWELEPADEGTTLTARVWASFPAGPLGRLVEWGFDHLLDGVERDYAHAMRELRYLKGQLEA